MSRATDALDRFQKTVELLSRNKITKSNAFENRLLDIDSKLAELSNCPEEERWRQYSTIIDAYGKVYGFCVDHVHEETFKILGGVSRTCENDLESRPQLQRRQVVQGSRTVETNESAINVREWDRSEKYDPDFEAMKKTFDSNKSSTMLLNIIPLNCNLNLVHSPEDLVLGIEYLEYEKGIAEFELVKPDPSVIHFSDFIENFLVNAGKKNSEFKEELDDMENPIESYGVLDSVESEEEVVKKEVNEIQKPSFKVTLEEKVSMGNLEMINNNVVFAKDFLETNVISKTKKRKKKEPLKEINYEGPLSVMKIEIDYEENNLMTGKDRHTAVEKEKDIGYKENRLRELFTRQGKFFSVTFTEQIIGIENWDHLLDNKDPFSVNDTDQLFEIREPGPSQGEQKMDLDIKKVKDSISNLICENKGIDFLSTIETLTTVLDNKMLEKLSVHSCFVALLHVANEKNLVLEKSDMCNFNIRSGK